MDPKRPPDPRRFNPDRFADDPTTLYQSATGDPKKRDNFVSGAGRCLRQGIHIAERSLFLGMSRMLWAFSVSKALDSKGLPITPDMDDLVGGITVQPRDFPAKFTPRSQGKIESSETPCASAKSCLIPRRSSGRKCPREWPSLPGCRRRSRLESPHLFASRSYCCVITVARSFFT